MQDAGHTHGGQDARDRGQREHEAHHDAGEVPREGAVDDDEDSAVGGALVEQPQAHGAERHEDVEVEVEGGPGGGLVLRHGGDDGDVPVVPGFRGVKVKRGCC